MMRASVKAPGTVGKKLRVKKIVLPNPLHRGRGWSAEMGGRPESEKTPPLASRTLVTRTTGANRLPSEDSMA